MYTHVYMYGHMCTYIWQRPINISLVRHKRTEGKKIGLGRGFWGYLDMFGTILASLRSRAPEGWWNLKAF